VVFVPATCAHDTPLIAFEANSPFIRGDYLLRVLIHSEAPL
jgi:hypothetical protein